MVDPINLRQARKAKARAEHAQKGAQNRATFGQKKSDRALNAAQTKLHARQLDGLRLIKNERDNGVD
jgi:hypothetical protein